MTAHWVISSSSAEQSETSELKATETENVVIGVNDDDWQTESDEDEPQSRLVKNSAKAVVPPSPPPKSPIFAPVELKTDSNSQVPLQAAVHIDPLASDILHLFADVFLAEQSTRRNSFDASQAQISSSLDESGSLTWHGAVIKCCSRFDTNFSAFLQRLEASATAALDSAYTIPEPSDAIKPGLATLSAEIQMVSHELFKSLEGSLWPLLDRFQKAENKLTISVLGWVRKLLSSGWCSSHRQRRSHHWQAAADAQVCIVNPWYPIPDRSQQYERRVLGEQWGWRC